MMELETLLYGLDNHVATITLNRPDRLNSFNQRMCEEFSRVWQHVRLDDEVHAVVVRAAGERAFCTGVDTDDTLEMVSRRNLWSREDPSSYLSPKANQVWKPVICAVHGMAAGGAFYLLNEADIIISSQDATFFDPHVSYGLAAVLEPVGLAARMPLGEVLRIALMGLNERMSASRAMQMGLVSEVTEREELWPRADEIAHQIAANEPLAVQGTVKAIWDSLDVGRTDAIRNGVHYTQLANGVETVKVTRGGADKPQWRLR
jgi:enoyl-CoA hydratase/carnithine racemase